MGRTTALLILLCTMASPGCLLDREAAERLYREERRRDREVLLSGDSSVAGKEAAFSRLVKFLAENEAPRIRREEILETLLDASMQFAGTDGGHLVVDLSWELGRGLSPREWRIVMRKEDSLISRFRETRSSALGLMLAAVDSRKALGVFRDILGRQGLERRVRMGVALALSVYESPEAEKLIGKTFSEKSEARAYSLFRRVRTEGKQCADHILRELRTTESRDARVWLVVGISSLLGSPKKKRWQEFLRLRALEVLNRRKRKGEINVKEFSELSKILSSR